MMPRNNSASLGEKGWHKKIGFTFAMLPLFAEQQNFGLMPMLTWHAIIYDQDPGPVLWS